MYVVPCVSLKKICNNNKLMAKKLIKNYIKIVVPRRHGNNDSYLNFLFNFFYIILLLLYFLCMWFFVIY